MIRALVSLVSGLRRAWLFELVGVAAIVGGVYLLAGLAWALVAFGVAAVLKAFEVDGS
jgi:hypothetical protein